MTGMAVVHRAAAVGVTQRIEVPFGATIEGIAQNYYGAVEVVTAWLRAPAGYPAEWIKVPREMWGWVRPKVADVLMFCYRPQGGKLLKSIFSIAASVAVLIAAPFLLPILGTFGTALASTLFLAGSSLLANKLFPTASEAIGGGEPGAAEDLSRRAFANVVSGSNVLAKEASLPLVAGVRRISPPEIAAPRVYLESGVQTLDRVFALDGHHQVTEVQVDGTPIGDYEGITTELRDGAETTTVETFIDKITSGVSVGEELGGFSTDGAALEDQEVPANSEPLPVRFSTIYHPDMEEVTIRLQLDAFYKSDSASANARVPVRLRFRPKGSVVTWVHLPEIHINGRDPSKSLKEIRVRWDDEFGSFDTGGEISYEFFQKVPAAANVLTTGATGDQWQADAHFVAGAGLTEVQNIAGRRHGLRVTLDPTLTPKGEFEWEVIRGAASASSSFAADTYKLSGTVYSFFEGQSISSEWRVPVDQGVYPVRVAVIQATLVIDQIPCQRPGTAVLALRSRGQTVRNVTTLAAAYVRDWDGSGWNNLTVTDNPATHYRSILAGYLDYHGIDTSLIADADFVAWRQECIDRGYKVSAVFAGASVAEALAAVAEAGFARPRFSDGYGIDYFRDRSAERPAITFSPRNSTISVKWLSPEAPLGLRGKFQNAEDGYRDDEVQVHASGYANQSGYEVAEFTSIASPALVRRRAMFDLLQRQYQSRRVWSVETAIEGALCERGTLVGLVTDLTDDVSFGARVREVIDGANIVIDQAIPVQATTGLYGETDVFDLTNLFETGEQTAVLVSTPTGTEMRNVVAADGRVIRVDAVFSSTDLIGAHLAVAPISRFTRRAIVTEVERQGEERATLTLIDEAPEIYQQLAELSA